MRLIGMGASLHSGRQRDADRGAVRSSAICITSDPVRYARTKAMLEAEPALGIGSPTVAWANAAFRAIDDFAHPAFTTKIRQPLMLIAAGRDEVVSTRGDRGLRGAAARRLASHRRGRQATS